MDQLTQYDIAAADTDSHVAYLRWIAGVLEDRDRMAKLARDLAQNEKFLKEMGIAVTR